ncbi:acyl-CoA N-acyltransferase [Basidiobolus meristosporus CBS 931.73]|uniref:Acyl-CoA N-acyltransferase n=1 Tax=Basidiobolus meristosporus CBS 931.73 TaxID=1314790 RepID=A0A1Y1XZR3_9FUNG|nr:acyl-CoA N-acyltransferase [Basidiobolus meristosporus CBS 931.73]|eukprot:ORX91253.1 acyl-CoA N-acyltransferase [Basidiobolus meristosporus CBS 931.73]
MPNHQLKVRTFQPSDTAAIHRIFAQGIAEPISLGFRRAVSLPKTVALGSVGPLAATTLCTQFLRSSTSGLFKRALIVGVLGSAAWAGSLIGLLYWHIRGGYQSYIAWSLGADLKDIKEYYRLEEIECDGGARQLVPTSDSQFWVCTLDEEVVGFVALDYQVQADGSKTWELRRMIVSSQHRRMGIAQLLIQTLLDWAKERGATNVHLMTSEMQHGAMKLYERFGWKEESRVKLMYGIDGVNYRLNLHHV